MICFFSVKRKPKFLGHLEIDWITGIDEFWFD